MDRGEKRDLAREEPWGGSAFGGSVVCTKFGQVMISDRHSHIRLARAKDRHAERTVVRTSAAPLRTERVRLYAMGCGSSVASHVPSALAVTLVPPTAPSRKVVMVE